MITSGPAAGSPGSDCVAMLDSLAPVDRRGQGRARADYAGRGGRWVAAGVGPLAMDPAAHPRATRDTIADATPRAEGTTPVGGLVTVSRARWRGGPGRPGRQRRGPPCAMDAMHRARLAGRAPAEQGRHRTGAA